MERYDFRTEGRFGSENSDPAQQGKPEGNPTANEEYWHRAYPARKVEKGDLGWHTRYRTGIPKVPSPRFT